MKLVFNPFTSTLDWVSEEDLSGYVPYTGATADVDLGNYSLTCGGTESGQSTIASGLVVNEDGGNLATDDFRAETVGNANALVVDASADEVQVNATFNVDGATTIGDGGTTNYTEIKTDGEINLHGTARVYKNQWINVQGFKAPGTKPATSVDWGISCAWEFSDGTDDTICTSIRIPQDMDRTVAPELKIGFSSDTNTGDVVWQLEYLYLAPNEDTTAAAQETLTTTTTISGTTDGLTIATITGMDLPSSTDQLIKMRIKRLGADGADTLSDDCVLNGIGLKYVADKLGIAL